MNKEDQVVQSAIQSYSRLVREYMSKCDDMLGKLGSEPDDMRYVINMGSRVISHIFNLVVSTSLCVETASKLARNGIYYYLEFIGQIGEDDHQYLKLTPKDAVIFVYKKTIDTISSRPSISDDVISSHGLDIIFSSTKLLSQSGTIFRDSQKGVSLSELVASCLKTVQHNDMHLLSNLQSLLIINFQSILIIFPEIVIAIIFTFSLILQVNIKLFLLFKYVFFVSMNFL